MTAAGRKDENDGYRRESELSSGNDQITQRGEQQKVTDIQWILSCQSVQLLGIALLLLAILIRMRE